MQHSFQHSTIAQILENILDEFTFEGNSQSNIGDILLSILNKTEYNEDPQSVIAALLLKLKSKIEGSSFEPYDGKSTSRIANIIISILNETEYTEPPQSRVAELLLELKNALAEITEVTASGIIASFITNMVAPIVAGKFSIIPQQSGTGTPSPSNIRPLIAFNSMNIFKSGDDLLADVSIENGKFIDTEGEERDANGYKAYDFIDVSNFTSIKLRASKTSTVGRYFRVCGYNSNKEFETLFYSQIKRDDTLNLSFDVTNVSYIRITWGNDSTILAFDGDTYDTYTINIGQNVYGGELDVADGVLSFKVTHGIVDFGDLSWRYGSGSQVFYTEDITDIKTETNFAGIECECFETLISNASLASMTNYSIKRGQSNTIIYIKDMDYTVPSDFVTAFTGKKFVYELAEPFEIQLPITELTIITLNGQNNIWCDTGNTEITYLYRGTPPENTRLLNMDLQRENILQEFDIKTFNDNEIIEEEDLE